MAVVCFINLRCHKSDSLTKFSSTAVSYQCSICFSLALGRVTIYLTDDAFSVKAKRFIQMFTSLLALFFLLRVANKSHFDAPNH